MSDDERLRRWRLVLRAPAEATTASLGADDARVDEVLGSLYDAEHAPRGGGLGASAPRVARWLGDIRTFFPSSVVEVLQQDALERLGLTRMLLEPELLAAVQPDVALVATLLSLSRSLPAEARETARGIVRQVVLALERRLKGRLVQAVRGALGKAGAGTRPRSLAEVDWHRTIRKNLVRWDAARARLVPDRFHAFAPRRVALRDVVLLIDQSGSMASSVVYAGVFGAVLGSLAALRTRVVAFDVDVVDLTDLLDDPVALLFGTQLGGGTDIGRALRYAAARVTRPADTVMVLVSDLYEGADPDEVVLRVVDLRARGVTFIALLALSDDGAPAFDHALAARLAALGVPAFACTPDRFPDLMAAALSRRDVGAWAGAEGLQVVPARR